MRPVKLRALLLAPCCVLMLAAACDAPKAPDQTFVFSARLEGEPGEPLAGVTLKHLDRVLGETDAAGFAALVLRGREGERVEIRADCPQGFHSPVDPAVALLRSYRGNEPPELALRCKPSLRRVVLAVLADKGRHLPVMHRSRMLARTDEQGVAHVVLEGMPGETFDVHLDTKGTRLRPRDPSRRVVVRERDTADVLRVDLHEERPPQRRRKGRKSPGPQLPTRIR